MNQDPIRCSQFVDGRGIMVDRGNIKTMYRTSFKHPQETTPRLIDNLSYSYDGNRVTNINDHSGNPNGYEGGNGTIAYDVNGNMTAMPDKGITNISYNFLNLPTILSDGNTTEYLYSADGTKLRKTLTVSHEGEDIEILTEYLDGFQYSTPNTNLISGVFQMAENGSLESAKTASEPEAFSLAEKNIGGGNVNAFVIDLAFFPTAEGFYDYENKRYIYQYKDQTGNVRMSYTRNTTTGAARVLDRNDYYAFGMNHLSYRLHSKYNPLSVPYNYKHSGKELQETGMYDFGWRQYMPDIGRWNGMDQLAEMYAPVSPYAYVANNPISLIDPDGRAIHEDDNGWTFTGADLKLVVNYFGAGGDYGNLSSQLENYSNSNGGNFGNSPVSGFWDRFNSNGTLNHFQRNGWLHWSTSTGAFGNGLLQQSNQFATKLDGGSSDNQEKALGVFFDVTESLGGFASSVLDDRFKYGEKYYNKPITIRTKLGPGINTTANKMKGLAKTGKLAGRTTRVLVGVDIALSGEVKASHILTGAMIGVNAIPFVGNTISGIYFGADLLTMGVSYLTTGEAKGIGDYLDQALDDAGYTSGGGTIVELYDGFY